MTENLPDDGASRGVHTQTEGHRSRATTKPLTIRTSGETEPIPMVLFCPACGFQHIDEPELPYIGDRITETGDEDAAARIRKATWTNPPHRSHLCLGCGHIWRPADVPTTGVAAIQTKGKADSEPVSPSSLISRAEASEEEVKRLREAVEKIAKLEASLIGDTGFAVGPLALFNAAQRIALDALKDHRRARQALGADQ